MGLLFLDKYQQPSRSVHVRLLLFCLSVSADSFSLVIFMLEIVYIGYMYVNRIIGTARIGPLYPVATIET